MKRRKFEKKISRNILFGLLALLVIVPSLCITWKMNDVQASEQETAYAKYYSDISAYRVGELTAPKPTVSEDGEDFKDWIFAGWYKEESLETSLTKAEANAAKGAWAKFVPEEILSVMGQLDSDPYTAEKVKLRLVTTIDSDQYRNVGFNISIPTLNGYSQDYPMYKAYRKIVANEGGVVFNYEPSVFHSMSEAFATVTIANISKGNFDRGIRVTPFWTTLDGTRVDGVGRYLRANDVLGDTVDIPVRLYSDTTVTEGSLAVEYDATTFQYLGMDTGDIFTKVTVDAETEDGEVVCTITDQNAIADGMFINLRFKLKDGVTLMNRAPFNEFAIKADDTWNGSHIIYTSMIALSDVTPDTIPESDAYQVRQRIGLDGTETAEGSLYKGKFNARAGVFEGALEFASGVQSGNTTDGGEAKVIPADTDTISLDGVTGVMWYVDFSNLETNLDSTNGFCTSVPLGCTTGGEEAYYRATNAVAYYYQDGKWEKSQIVDGNDRIGVPNQYKGWVYVTLNSYVNRTEESDAAICDTNGVGLANATVDYVNLYSDGYAYDTEKYMVWDEVLFVKGLNLSDVIPEELPDSVDYEVGQRIGLDGIETTRGKKYWGGYDDEAGIFFGALSFATGAYEDTTSGATSALDPTSVTDGTLTGGEARVTPAETISLEGITGVMWYVDFSGVARSAEGSGLCTSVPLNCKKGGRTTYYRTAEDAVAYYYQNGAWVESSVAEGGVDRISVPDGYKGWVYAPLSSYIQRDGNKYAIYDIKGVGLEGITLNYVNLYSAGYDYNTDTKIVWDEILFVKGKNVENVIPESLPNSDVYQVKQRIGLDGTETATGTKYWGEFDANEGVLGGALSFASGVYAGSSGATTAKDPATTTGTLSGGEVTVTPADTISLDGVKGVMWYVDFSDLTKDEDGNGFCASVYMSCKIDNKNVVFRSTNSAGGYIYQNGAWEQRPVATGGTCRISVPDNYKGWVYVPLSSYDNRSGTTAAICDENGVGLAGVTLNYVNLYSRGYELDTTKNITWDEILFVKGANLSDVIPANLPDSDVYEVQQRVGLDETEIAQGTTYRGGFDADAGIHGGALSIASGVSVGENMSRGEATVYPSSEINMAGVTGVMWYVDFGDLTKKDDGNGFCTSVPLHLTKDGSTIQYRTSKKPTAYYYENGAWVESTVATGGVDRISVPTGYEGWVYAPISSYVKHSDKTSIFDHYDKGLTDVTLNCVNLYSDGYVYDRNMDITWDEILFVKGSSVTDVIPENLPDSDVYEISQRIGLEGTEAVENTKYWGGFEADAGAFEGALSFASGVYAGESGETTALDPTSVTDGTLTGGEAKVTPAATFSLEGVTGVMWYVDFSHLTKDADGNGFCASVPLGLTVGESTTYYRTKMNPTAYYYENGAWVETTRAVGGTDRISVPDQYKGWIYAPLESYVRHSGANVAICDAYGAGLANVTLNYVHLYSKGYEFETDKNIIWDEILFVKGSNLSDVIPATLPDSDVYEVTQRVGLDGTETVKGNKYWGNFDAEKGVFEGALSFASGVYTNPDSGATALDPDTVDTATQDLAGGEATVYPSTEVSLEGVTGVMWHVDFSELTTNTDETRVTQLCTSVPLQTAGENAAYYRTYNAVAYYYQNGAWVESSVADGKDRIGVPDNYVGWVYVPLSSYDNRTTGSEAEICDTNGVGLEGVTLDYVRLFSEGYRYDADNTIVWDEVLFVKGFQLADVIPANLPDSDLYEVTQRVGLEGTEIATGSKFRGRFSAESDILGRALSFASGLYDGTSDTLVGGEATVTPAETISLDGVTGVMWHVDFSDLTKDDEGVGFCTSVPLNCTTGETTATYRTYNTDTYNAIAYYYQDGEWVKSSVADGKDRISVPDNYAGWVYVPLSSYDNRSDNGASICDKDGVGLEDVTLNYVNLYSAGYTYETNKKIVWDEILFVTGSSLSDVTPETLPDNVAYEVGQRIGLDDAETAPATGTKYWGGFQADAGVFEGALSFASGVYQDTTSGATSALDPTSVSNGTLVGGEATVTPTDKFSLEGVTGVMWYVDFSGLEKSTTKTPDFCASVYMSCKINGKDLVFRSTNSAGGYIYQNGAWEPRPLAKGGTCRISVPDNYKGWVYVPLSSYVNRNGTTDAICDENGIGLAGVTLNSVNLYSNGYVFDTTKNITWDEILFVKTDLTAWNFTYKDLGIRPYTVEVEDATIAAAEILEDGSLAITPKAAGETNVNVANSYGETVTIAVTVSSDLKLKASYTAYDVDSVVATNYGLKTSNRGDTNATKLQSAIDSLSDGGVVYIPKGTYNLGLIEMKEGVTLRLEGVLDNYNQPYSNVQSQVESGEFAVLVASENNMFLNHEAYGYGRTGADNLAVSGGVIDMAGTARAFIWCCADGVTLENVIMKDCPNNHAIQVTGSKNVTIRNVMFAGYNYTNNFTTGEVVQIESTSPTSIGTDSTLSVFADYEYISSEKVVIEDCYFGASDEYGAPTFAIGHHSCPAKYSATGITIKGCTFDDPRVCAIRAYGWKDVEITGCSFTSTVASELNADEHYMIELDYPTGSDVTVTSGAYLAKAYERGGIANLNIHDNTFTIGASSLMQGLLKSVNTTSYAYGAKAESLSVVDSYDETAYTFTGYKMVNNQISNVRFCDNAVSIANAVGADYINLTNVKGLLVSGNSTEAGTTNITKCTSLENYQKNFVVSANSYAPVTLSGTDTSIQIKYDNTTYYNLTITCSGNGKIERSVDADGNLVVEAVADDGYKFNGFYVGSTKLSENETYSAAKTITAKFVAE